MHMRLMDLQNQSVAGATQAAFVKQPGVSCYSRKP